MRVVCDVNPFVVNVHVTCLPNRNLVIDTRIYVDYDL